LDENQIIAAVCAHLQAIGFVVTQRLHTTEHGVDIVARNGANGRTIYVEAKGGTSSREGSARFGRPYTQSQVFDRVSKGVFTALELRARYPDRTTVEVALAVPESRWFRSYLTPVRRELADAGLTVLFVDAASRVAYLDIGM
jgi:hypothetical protein